MITGIKVYEGDRQDTHTHTQDSWKMINEIARTKRDDQLTRTRKCTHIIELFFVETANQKYYVRADLLFEEISIANVLCQKFQETALRQELVFTKDVRDYLRLKNVCSHDPLVKFTSKKSMKYELSSNELCI